MDAVINFFVLLNILLGRLLSTEYDLTFAIRLLSKHLFCMDVILHFFGQQHILLVHL
jgi:hypothetical protein